MSWLRWPFGKKAGNSNTPSGKTKMPACVAAYIKAYNAKDVEGMLATLHNEVKFKSYGGGEVTASTHNKAAFARLAHMSAQAFSQRKQTVVTSFTLGNTVVLTIRFEATVAADMPNGWKAGQVLDFRGASEFLLEGDTIISITDQSG